MTRLPDKFRERTKRYAAALIRLFGKLPKEPEEARFLARQLLRTATSVAAHVRDASRARSDAEFASQIGAALQEADKSVLSLELLREECSVQATLTQPLEKESVELIAIFTAMINRTLPTPKSEA